MTKAPDYARRAGRVDYFMTGEAPELQIQTVPETLVAKLRKQLQDSVKEEFRAEVKEHGSLLHRHLFGGGMSIRNWMRAQTECKDWTDHAFDDTWMVLTYAAIGLDPVDAIHTFTKLNLALLLRKSETRRYQCESVNI